MNIFFIFDATSEAFVVEEEATKNLPMHSPFVALAWSGWCDQKTLPEEKKHSRPISSSFAATDDVVDGDDVDDAAMQSKSNWSLVFGAWLTYVGASTNFQMVVFQIDKTPASMRLSKQSCCPTFRVIFFNLWHQKSFSHLNTF